MANEPRSVTLRRSGLRLTLDPIACDGKGVCADLLGELIHLDDWGYPIISGGGEVPAELVAEARAAVAACPKLALRLSRS